MPARLALSGSSAWALGAGIGGVILALVVALGATGKILLDTRESLGVCRAGMDAALVANQSNQVTIRSLTEQRDRARTERDAALAKQADVIAKLALIEQRMEHETAEAIVEIVRIADTDDCAIAPVADGLRDAAGYSAHGDRRGGR